MNKDKGFTLVELIAVIAIISLISIIAIPEVVKVMKKAEKESFESHVRGIIRAANYEFKRIQMESVPEEETIFTFVNGVESSSVEGAKLEYEGEKIQNGVVKIREDGKVALAIYNEKWCAIKKFNSNELIISNFTTPLNCELQQKVDISGANPPKLTTGMTPVIWNGNNWVEASNIDDPYEQNWYDYANKKWANAKTADGSYWVWIPRYAYKITSGFHSSSAGNIDIKFLKGTTNKAADGSIVETSGYNFGTKDTSTHYFLHPAFTFGDEEIPGFWVAKFEPSGTADNISIVPKVSSLSNMKIGDQFTAAFNMRNNSKYGWNANEVDTHMMKNTEWGAVAYLSKSIYGANDEIWINNSSKYITGCARNSLTSSPYNGCQNAYNTPNGQKASTTHNIYGVYDMSGGAYEYVAAYVDNGHNNLTAYGQSILNAASKYKDVYVVGVYVMVPSDTQSSNYEINRNKYGDAVYETSNGYDGSYSWYGDYSYMPYSSDPFFARGGYYDHGSSAGAFHFSHNTGPADSSWSFRPVVVPAAQ